MRPLLSLPLLALAAACGPGPRAVEAPGTVAEVPSPAGEGSGEPYLSSAEDGVLMSWLERSPEGGHDLWVARLDSGGWGPRHRVAHGDDFFVNWADFPSVVADGDGTLWAHWLQREGAGTGLAYGVRLARSTDGGATWSEPWTPHEDATPTEHGFVTLFPGEGEIAAVWLDGRAYAPGPAGEPPTREMSLRTRVASAGGEPGPEVLLDGRTCDCCQTDAARTSSGPVIVYRDRSEDEVRDIYITRWTPDGWTSGSPVHEDGWLIEACPVNGPAVDARDARVVVAWFTGAGDEPRVYAAFSSDAGATFAPPVRVDGGTPAGRVDVRMRRDGSALVSWLERTGGDRAELRLAHVHASGGVRSTWIAATSSSARASGFPRLALPPWDPDGVLVAWTDVADPARVRVVRLGPGAP